MRWKNKVKEYIFERDVMEGSASTNKEGVCG